MKQRRVIVIHEVDNGYTLTEDSYPGAGNTYVFHQLRPALDKAEEILNSEAPEIPDYGVSGPGLSNY